MDPKRTGLGHGVLGLISWLQLLHLINHARITKLSGLLLRHVKGLLLNNGLRLIHHLHLLLDLKWVKVSRLLRVHWVLVLYVSLSPVWLVILLLSRIWWNTKLMISMCIITVIPIITMSLAHEVSAQLSLIITTIIDSVVSRSILLIAFILLRVVLLWAMSRSWLRRATRMSHLLLWFRACYRDSATEFWSILLTLALWYVLIFLLRILWTVIRIWLPVVLLPIPATILLSTVLMCSPLLCDQILLVLCLLDQIRSESLNLM